MRFTNDGSTLNLPRFNSLVPMLRLDTHTKVNTYYDERSHEDRGNLLSVFYRILTLPRGNAYQNQDLPRFESWRKIKANPLKIFKI